MTLPPGPHIPTIVSTYRLIKHPYRFLLNCHRKYGDIFTVPMVRFNQIVYLADPDLVKEIFTVQAKKLTSGESTSFLEPFLGENSLLLLDGHEHTRQRKLLMPAFHGERIQLFGDLMRESAEEMVAGWPAGSVITLCAEMQQITLRVIVESIFGPAMSRRMPEILEMVRGFVNVPPLLTFLPFLRIDLGQWSAWGRFLAWRRRLDSFLYAEIERRRQVPKEPPADVLDLILMSRDEGGDAMSPKEIRDQLLTLLIAGHETTAVSLTWFFATLLRNPAVMEKLLSEQRAITGGAPVSAQMLPQMRYLEAAIKESMRINNLFPAVIRKTTEPIEIGGFQLPAGTSIAPCNLLVHLSPKLYPEPEQFRPERYLDDTHPFGWFPFGGGPRRCIGMNFALFEMKMLLATILPRVEMELLPGQSFYPKRMMLTMAPPTGVQVRIKRILTTETQRSRDLSVSVVNS